MSTASRNKGARFELEILKYLRERGYSAMRSRQFKQGGSEEPDVLACQAKGNIPLHIEGKNRKTLPSKGHVDALVQAEQTCSKGGVAIAVHKIARAKMEDAIVTMRFGTFLALYEGRADTAALLAALTAIVEAKASV